MKQLRIVLGILLIVGAMGGLAYWEIDGREAVLMDPVLVAKDQIKEGTMITENLFRVSGVMEENRIDGALEPMDLSTIVGKIAAETIVKNSQIVSAYFVEQTFFLNRGESIFVIQPEWISMRSSSLRRGDIIDIYEANGHSLFGTFRIAFVKDVNELEVYNQEGQQVDGVLDRLSSTALIDHIEIIARLSEYQKIFEYAVNPDSKGLLLVHKDVKR